ncbi:MAG: hypothetical protein CFK48_06765 [Armatimonadetes bacterium CP1_7O]|jgi:hypothetical protein|nr:MAG: hypothetical protein CFK48_06765 [Armatimonadetes bacterium CP1_7O]
MRRWSRYTPYLIVLLAFLGLLGWIRYEHHRGENFVRESVSFAEPNWANTLPLIRAEAQRHATEETKLAALTQHLTAAYRQMDVPLRFKVVRTDDDALAVRLNAGVMLPRWYTARAARIAHTEARRLLGHEIPIHIYETYVVGRSRWIGDCRERNGILEVALR